jgi:hypothetical protein
VTEDAEAFLADCRRQPTAVNDTDHRWPLIKVLEADGLLTVERTGARYWQIHVVDRQP